LPASNNTPIGKTKYRVKFIHGDKFCLDVPPGVPALWGEDTQVLWAEGEPLLLCGPDGVGKTTIGQQVVLGLLGLRSEVLGLPVRTVDRVLYLAIDRRRQAQRSFHRMVAEKDRAVLHERLWILGGSLPNLLENDPEVICAMAQAAEAQVVVVDSLKDTARKMSSDETGSAIASAFRYCEDAGIDVMALHHQRKEQQGAGSPTGLSDVYGSRLITAACGSVALLWGQAGDTIVQFKHLKQPAEPVGPWDVHHDHPNGVSTVLISTNLVVLAGMNGGLTAKTAAMALYTTESPDRNQVAAARTRLERLLKKGKLVKARHGSETAYQPAPSDSVELNDQEDE
jgi:replicative DNA helicase